MLKKKSHISISRCIQFENRNKILWGQKYSTV